MALLMMVYDTDTKQSVPWDGKSRPATPVASEPTDLSGTIAVADTGQALVAADPDRQGFFFQNTSAGPLTVNIFGTATETDGMVLAAGAMWPPNAGVPAGAISVWGETLAQSFTAWVW